MAYQIAAIPMTLRDLQGHLLTAGLFYCNIISCSCAAVDTSSKSCTTNPQLVEQVEIVLNGRPR